MVDLCKQRLKCALSVLRHMQVAHGGNPQMCARDRFHGSSCVLKPGARLALPPESEYGDAPTQPAPADVNGRGLLWIGTLMAVLHQIWIKRAHRGVMDAAAHAT